MRFSSSHGSNVVLEEESLKATRKSDLSFCDGIVFSETPLSVNCPLNLGVQSKDTKWGGSLMIGLIAHSPSLFTKERPLPRYSYCKSFLTEGKVWIRPTSSSWANSRLVLLINSNHELVVAANGQQPQVLLKELPTERKLWLLLDLFGTTSSVTFIQFNVEEAVIPMDIVLLGPDVTSAYKNACRQGSVPFNKGRIFFVGPYNTGKSSVKQALLGLSSEDNEPVETLDVSCFCESDAFGEWNPRHDKAEEREDWEEKLPRIFAHNIKRVTEYYRKLEKQGTCSTRPSDLMKSALRLSNRKYEDKLFEESVWLEGLPDSLSGPVEAILSDENQTHLSATGGRVITDKTREYNLWDFSGDSLYFLLHQVLLTSYAVYLMVIDISEDLEAPISSSSDTLIQAETRKSDFTTLNLIHYWLSVIYSHVGQHLCSVDFDKELTKSEERQEVASAPKVIILGTHRNSVHLEPITRDQVISETFDKIQQSLEKKHYKLLVHPKFYAIDCSQMSYDEPALMNQLRVLVDQTFADQKLLGFDVPFIWLEFEQIVQKLVKRGIYFVDINQLFEVTRSQLESSFDSYEVFRSTVQFYQTQGHILFLSRCYPETQGINEEIVILDPVWFLNRLYQLCDSVRRVVDDENSCYGNGILQEETINKVWEKWMDHKLLLLGCLEKLDFVCELRPYLGVEDPPDVAASAMQPKVYFFPWITQLLPEGYHGIGLQGDAAPDSSLKLALDFKGLLPIGLFSRLVVRLGRWSWSQGWGRRPEVCHAEARLAVDFDHDLVLRIHLNSSRIDVIIIKIYESIQNEDNGFTGPTPNICVKVRHLLESELEIIRNAYYRRIIFSLEVPCPCNLVCTSHQTQGCKEDTCEHFVSLDKCLSNKVIECDYRQVRTTFVQKYFPQAHFFSSGNHSYEQMHEVTSGTIFDLVNGWEQIFRIEPLWMREAAKMLSQSNPGRDWLSLAKRLGYSDRDIAKLVDEVSPALALIRDWYESNGRTKYSVEVLQSCLRMISRDDVRTAIDGDLEPEGSAPPIFISYQWDSQEAVLDLRRKLELAGFPCWMDVGLMGGGDSLYGKIYDGISRAKVVISCLTPRYAASRICGREVTLADVLHKPILPIMIEQTPWPPPGPMAIVMSSLVYVDLCGVGGHGGIGKRGDSESRFRDILDRISRYIAGFMDAPVINRHLHLPDIFSGERGPSPHMATMSPSPAIRVETPSDESEQQSNQGLLGAEAPQDIHQDGLTFGPEDALSDDSISVLSHIHSPNNRISNCSICTIL